MILLDTDICIEILRGNNKVIKNRETESEDTCICFMSIAELFYGAEKSKHSEHNIDLIEKLLLSINIINSDTDIMRKFGQIKASLFKSKIPLSDADIFIAATALAKCNKLITGNIRHFSRIKSLKIENWIR